MNPQTYVDDENLTKEEIVLNYIRNSESFRLFLKTLDSIEPLKGVTFSFTEKARVTDREFNEEELKRGNFTKKLEQTNMVNPEIIKVVEDAKKSKELVRDADGSIFYEE